jgi:hypothetical protein
MEALPTKAPERKQPSTLSEHKEQRQKLVAAMLEDDTEEGLPTRAEQERERGAMLFWETVQTIRAEYQRLDQAWLKMSRVLGEFKRRLDTIEDTLAVHREILSKDEARVHFLCIACDTGFELPLSEAIGQDFTAVCPDCGNWALAFPRRAAGRVGGHSQEYHPRAGLGSWRRAPAPADGAASRADRGSAARKKEETVSREKEAAELREISATARR